MHPNFFCPLNQAVILLHFCCTLLRFFFFPKWYWIQCIYSDHLYFLCSFSWNISNLIKRDARLIWHNDSLFGDKAVIHYIPFFITSMIFTVCFKSLKRTSWGQSHLFFSGLDHVHSFFLKDFYYYYFIFQTFDCQPDRFIKSLCS